MDGKAITDALPNASYEQILSTYANEKDKVGFDFSDFFYQYFDLPQKHEDDFQTNKKDSIENHIKRLWKVLSRQPDEATAQSSLIPLPYPYIVPGGRFGEVYYWDTYFTMLGMKAHGLKKELRFLVQNFAHLINNIGYIPNGNRDYYLGRSQPPFFSLMVELLSSIEGKEVMMEFLPMIEKEYLWFCSKERNHIVHGHQVTTYYDDNETPRWEMYGDDLDLVKDASDKSKMYRNIRAACESGWDFSSRWLHKKDDLATIDATRIVPIDLNCLLQNMERILGEYTSDPMLRFEYKNKANKRSHMINNLLWDAKVGCYKDYHIDRDIHMNVISCATLYPLFLKLSSNEQSASVARIVEEKLLHAGGLASTDQVTHHQWDCPNGWAPLQWIGYQGLKYYGHHILANKIKSRWMSLNESVFASTGKMMEKYNVVDLTREAGGGEYDVQDGFGWTNGVYVAMMWDI
jgi:alpha,alpha-trehalase